ncbi:MAG TPA: branched-chain amino acid transaminase [Vicinamibacterales bacterium]|nr:branched-chain amino acid transaminase [Vicinamibacterales bacterium]
MSTAPKVWLNGRLVPAAEATLSFLTPGLHYGIAVFEGLRAYETAQGPAIFRLGDHMRRLIDSALVLGFRTLPYSADELADAAKDTVRTSGLGACYIRPLIYLAEGGWNLTVDTGKPHVGIAVWPWKDYLGAEAVEQGVRANVSSFTRLHPNVNMTKAKIAGNYANSVLAKTESVRLGFDETIMLDPQGYVAECSGENLFVVRRGEITTPPPGAILEGITRDTVIQLASDLGYDVAEEPLSRDALYTADEVFVTGTAAEVIGLREIDFRTIGSGRTGPVTRALQQSYTSLVTGDHSRSEEWLDYVSRDCPEPSRPSFTPFEERKRQP